MVMKFCSNGSEYIQSLIDNAKKDGTNKAVITGNYEIEKTILIPSDFYLVLENCHLRMASNTFCNMFTNESCYTEKGKTLEGTDCNITIEGRGKAILDGGEFNGLSEATSRKDGYPPVYVNNVLLFTNVDGFKITGLHIRNQRWWAMNFICCRHGRIRDIDFLADYTRIDENGNRVPGLIYTYGPEKGGACVVNADGIDIRCGCHDIIIEDITGFTEDDTVAITSIKGKMERELGVEELLDGIHNIIVRNVNTSALCSMVRLLNQGGSKLYNILIDGIIDSSKDSKYMERGGTGIRVGDTYMYGKVHSTADDCYNITIKNVYSRALAVMRIAGEMKNCHFENINGFDGNEVYIENNSTMDIEQFFKN